MQLVGHVHNNDLLVDPPPVTKRRGDFSSREVVLLIHYVTPKTDNRARVLHVLKPGCLKEEVCQNRRQCRDFTSLQHLALNFN
jgi:hypothetical protein